MIIEKYLKLILQVVILLCFSVAFAAQTGKKTYNSGNFAHTHSEAAYQYAWCKAHNGITEYENPDKTRVDCITPTHAVEFDFANKWAEGVGQALHYGVMTKRKPKVVLIVENPKQLCFFERVQNLAKIYNFDAEYVTDDILKLNEYGKCKYAPCKCHKYSN